MNQITGEHGVHASGDAIGLNLSEIKTAGANFDLYWNGTTIGSTILGNINFSIIGNSGETIYAKIVIANRAGGDVIADIGNY